MPIKTIFFKSNGNVKWQWPFKVGITPKDKNLADKLLERHWPKEFSTIQAVTVANQQAHYNILITQYPLAFIEVGTKFPYTADVLIIISKDVNKFDKLLPAFAKLLTTMGVFVIAVKEKDISNWFYDFTVHLSHNNSFVDALRSSTTDGVFFYDKKLQTETNISHVIKNLVWNLKNKVNPSQNFDIVTRLRQQNNFTPNQLADLLEQHESTAFFGAESGEASDFSEITKPVYKKIEKKIFKKAGAKKVMKGRVPAGRGHIESVKKGIADKNVDTQKILEDIDLPRYLQGRIKTADKKTIIADSLKPDTAYCAEIMIGYEDDEFIHSEEVLDTGAIFKDNKKQKEKIQLKFKSNQEEETQFAEIELPRLGNSILANFAFTTVKSAGIFKADIYAYHKNRLIQQVQLIASILKKAPTGTKKKVKMKVVATIRKDLGNLASTTTFAASVEFVPGKNNGIVLQGISKNKPVDLFNSNGLKENLADIKAKIEDALIDIKQHPANLTAKGNVELMRFLAFKGNLIYTNHLRGVIAPSGPLQIISKTQEFVPLEFVYTLPPPDMDANLCAHAAEALKAGECKNCFDRTADPAPHICPFGFWSFSRIIERHSFQRKTSDGSADYSILSEPTTTRNTLNVFQNAIYGSSKRVETDQTLGLRQAIGSAIKKNILHLYEADDWDSWATSVKANKPDSLILVVHVEENLTYKVDQIEIGDKKFLLQNYFGSKLMNKEMPNPPLIIMIGCEVTDTEVGGFDLAGQLINDGAAIVLSNFTKIRGRQAKDIVIKLVELLKQSGKTDAIFGEVMLKLRQQLLAEGLMAGLSLVAQGDADWKLKT